MGKDNLKKKAEAGNMRKNINGLMKARKQMADQDLQMKMELVDKKKQQDKMIRSQKLKANYKNKLIEEKVKTNFEDCQTE